MNKQCKYHPYARCTLLAAENSDFCEGHSKNKCCSCGEQATHDCLEQSWFICGWPLCDNCCACEIDGHNHSHKKKS